MNKLTTMLLCGVLALGAAACQDVARTTPDAPGDTNRVGQAPEADEVRDTRQDSASNVREAQRQSDERARTQRSDTVGSAAPTSDGDLQSLVRNNLEREIPGAPLSVNSDDGAVTVAGTVQTQEQLSKIQPTVQQVPGVKSVKVNVEVAPAQPNQ